MLRRVEEINHSRARRLTLMLTIVLTLHPLRLPLAVSPEKVTESAALKVTPELSPLP